MTNDILSPCNKKIYAQVPRYITKPLFSEHIWEMPSAKERKRATNIRAFRSNRERRKISRAQDAK